MRNRMLCGVLVMALLLPVGCSHQKADDFGFSNPQSVINSPPRVPSWVQEPQWAKDNIAQGDPEKFHKLPRVLVSSRLVQWAGAQTIQPAISNGQYAIVSDEVAKQAIDELIPNESFSSLSSPRILVALGQSSWVGILETNKKRESGTVFFLEPAAIEHDGAQLQYSYQTLGNNNDNPNAEASDNTPSRLEGIARLNVGQWLIREFEDNDPYGIKKALFIKIERVDFPSDGGVSVGG